jgi:hypothetical protein|tara:strand:- start:1572 stop:2540 length:969 start_codon:yes stop_codon:yes gene_type:complete
MTRAVISGVATGTQYDVKVRARNMAGKYSAMSAISQITIPTKTSAPGNVTSHSATSDPISITIKWTNPSDTDLKGVEIYYSTSSGSGFSLLASVDGVPGTVNEFNWNYEDTLSLNQTYYFKLRAVNTSLVAGSYTTEINAQFSTIGTVDITLQAISNMYSAVTSNNQSLSTVANSITYSSNSGGSTSTLQGIIAAEITLGSISSDISGFAINASAMVQKKGTWSPNKYVTGVVLQKVAGNAYYEQATGFGSSASFLGDNVADSQDYADGAQATYSTNSIDSSGDVIGTTGSKYALFLYTNSEPSYNLGVFAGTGLTVTELKR